MPFVFVLMSRKVPRWKATCQNRFISTQDGSSQIGLGLARGLHYTVKHLGQSHCESKKATFMIKSRTMIFSIWAFASRGEHKCKKQLSGVTCLDTCTTLHFA